MNNLNYLYNIQYNEYVKIPDIIYAAEIGANERIEKALSLGEDVNVQEPATGITALHAAVANGHYETVQLLLNRVGIDLHIKDKFGRSPVGLAISIADDPIISLLTTHQITALPDLPDASP